MKYSKNFLLGIIVLFLIPVVGNAQALSLSQAKVVAEQFFNSQSVKRTSVSDLTFVWDGESEVSRTAVVSPSFYVFNRGNNGGFVIVSGFVDENPILGYSMSGAFVVEGMPENVRVWMRVLRDVVRAQNVDCADAVLEDGDFVYSSDVLQMSGEVDLNTPNYDQQDPYNSKCPILSNGLHAYPGCTITATTIVMGFHRWPDMGMGTIPIFKSPTAGKLGPITLGDSYDWDNIDDIATIMFQLGVMFRAEYKTWGTGAPLENVVSELPKYMKYNKRMKYLKRDSFDFEVWKGMLRKSIDDGLPLVYEGYDNTSTGHAFVVDGYNDQGMFNINWGWGGFYNGFFDLDRMNPSGSGVGGNTDDAYNFGQAGIFDMSPIRNLDSDIDMVEFVKNQSFADGIEVRDMPFPVKKGDSFNVDAGIVKNFGNNVIHNDFMLVMTDANGNIVEEFFRQPAFPLEPASTQVAMERPKLIEVKKK